MYTRDNQDKFIELRAQGWSLRHIATEIHVSKRTLVDWNREFASDIQSMRTLEAQALQDKFLASREDELNRLARLQKDVQDEIDNRTLKFEPLDKLFRLSTELRQEMERLRGQNTPSATALVAAEAVT